MGEEICQDIQEKLSTTGQVYLPDLDMPLSITKGLFGLLDRKRKELAKARGVPEVQYDFEDLLFELYMKNPGGGKMDDIQAKRIAEEAAVKAVELQGSRVAEQVAKEMSAELLHQSPVSPHCEAVLEMPPRCYDFRGIRSWVMCKAWDIMEKEKRTRLPVGEAWSEARRVCVFEEERERRERVLR